MNIKTIAKIVFRYVLTSSKGESTPSSSPKLYSPCTSQNKGWDVNSPLLRCDVPMTIGGLVKNYKILAQLLYLSWVSLQIVLLPLVCVVGVFEYTYSSGFFFSSFFI
jgi:hypothetical protein